MVAALIFVLGLLIGSFLNVCIHRMPLEQSIVKPRSHCPECKKTIPWYDNIPLLSFIMLGGKCRFCKVKISWRYFLVELLTGAVFVFFFYYFGLGFNFVYYVLFTCGLLVSTFVDIKHRIIPDEISVGGMFLGLGLNLFRSLGFPGGFAWDPKWVIASALGAVIGGGIIYLTGKLFDLVYFKLLKRPAIDGETESMGGGDVKLLAMIGAFLGWKVAVLAFFIAPFFGVIVGVYNLLLKKEHTIPYGPFLSLAALIAFFWGTKITRALLGV